MQLNQATSNSIFDDYVGMSDEEELKRAGLWDESMETQVAMYGEDLVVDDTDREILGNV